MIIEQYHIQYEKSTNPEKRILLIDGKDRNHILRVFSVKEIRDAEKYVRDYDRNPDNYNFKLFLRNHSVYPAIYLDKDHIIQYKIFGRFLEPIVAPSIFKFLLEHHITYRDTRDIYIYWNKGLNIYKISLSPKS